MNTTQGGAPELDLLTTFGSLIFVVALILGLAWLLRRMRLPAMGNQKGLAIVRQIPVGPKERIAVVKAGEEQFLVGMTVHSINLIARLEQPVDTGQMSDGEHSGGDKQVADSFAGQFSQLLRKHDKK
ncbi:flagellar biosynthetic protein FliO [Vibrio sp. HA2012]|uniref:flagellar biosynthetic protein FliO n=1 Tax=Vibrio sp. HA2012 TaxID=1971595 RepID=UPI000C2B834D|nr:flagellar biosynthetic protein FliO [Vibrio sp. HA2012]PJC88259.1 flagellar biosynthetic protein FliO [Vibrio sp. HA2012]